MNYSEEMAKLTEERSEKERDICLNCGSTEKCKGICDYYRQQSREIKQEYKDKCAELKEKRKALEAAKPRVRRKRKKQNKDL